MEKAKTRERTEKREKVNVDGINILGVNRLARFSTICNDNTTSKERIKYAL